MFTFLLSGQASNISSVVKLLLDELPKLSYAGARARIASIGDLTQWSAEKSDVLATLAAVFLFCLIWIGMVRLESGLTKRKETICNGSSDPCSAAQPSSSNRWRVMQGNTDIFASPAEQDLLDTKASLRKLRLAAITTGLLMVVILIAGHAVGSLSLRGDGIHLLGDTIGYFGLFFATVASQWDADETFTFGWGRIEHVSVLGAVAIQYHEASNVAYEAYERVWNPKPLQEDAGMLITIFACLSMVVNLGLVAVLSGSGTSPCGHNHGDSAVGMALIHLLCDLGQNIIVLLTGIVLWIWPRFYIVDSICVLFFLILLFFGTLPRVWDIVCVLLEASPGNVDVMQLRKDLLNIKGVKDVRHIHVWCITPGKVVVVAHLYAKKDPMDVLQDADCLLKHKYGIQQFTFQVSDDDPV